MTSDKVASDKVGGDRVQSDRVMSDEGKVIRTYRDLDVWLKAYQLCIEFYRVSKLFPKEEQYGLTLQMRRAVVSVVSNIAEGCGRKTTPEYVQSVYVAHGSLCEFEAQMLIAADLGYVERGCSERFLGTVGDVARMLKALIRSLVRKLAAR